MKQNKENNSRQGFVLFPKAIAQGFHYAKHALLGYLCIISLSANAATVYFNDFQDTIGSEWTTTAASGIHITPAPHQDYVLYPRLFLGEYNNDTLTLSLGGLSPHTTATVSFSLYLIRSWDGNDPTVVDGDLLGNDTWSLSVDGGPPLLSATFSNGNSVAGKNYDGAFSTYTYTPWTPCNAY